MYANASASGATTAAAGAAAGSAHSGSSSNTRVPRQAWGQRALRDHRADAGVAQHVECARHGVCRIQWHVSGAGLDDGQQRQHGTDRALDVQADRIARAHAVCAQLIGQALAGFQQLLVREARYGQHLRRGVCALERHGMRPAARRGVQQRRQVGIARERPRGGIPALEDALTLRRAQHVEPADHLVGRTQHAGGERTEVVAQTFRRAGVEQRRVVLERGADALRLVPHEQRQVHHRRHGRDVECRCQWRVLQGEHHLVHRRPRQVALRAQLVDDLLEWQCAVRLRVDHVLTHLAQQRAPRQAGLEIAADRQRADEHADDTLDLAGVTIGHRRADHDVALAAVAVQQHVEHGQQRHVQRGALAAGQCAQAVRQLGRQRKVERGALEAASVGSRPVGGQRQRRRCVAQSPAPVGKQVIERLARQRRALARGMFAVAQLQRHKGRRASGAARLVGDVQIGQEDAERPAVADDVVHGEQQHVIVGGQPQQRGAKQRPARQVERPRRLLAREPPLLGISLRRRQQRQIEQRHRLRLERPHHLHRLATGLIDHGAQRVLAAHHVVDRFDHGCHVDCGGDPMRSAEVVRTVAWLELVEEPQAALRERHRKLTAAVAAALREQCEQLRLGLRDARLQVVGELPGGGAHAQPLAVGRDAHAE